MHLIRRLFFFWIAGFLPAIAVYRLLSLVLRHHVYGAWYRMYTYHYSHPVQYMLIPCFFFGIIAAVLLRRFAQKRTTAGRIGTTVVIIVLTIVISSPFGGMLWELHDAMAGYFPASAAADKIIFEGTAWGLQYGWLVILLSIPYNLIGGMACYFILRAGVMIFEPGTPKPRLK